MKLHLPKRLLTALIAAISFLSPAALTLGSAAWGEDSATTVTGLSTPEFWGAEYTWIDGGWKNSAGQSVASPGRSDNGGPNSNGADGPVLIFAEGVSANVSQSADTSDGGGIIVKKGADVTCNLGKWGGFVYVEEGASLETSFGIQQKNVTSEGVQDTHATFYVDGTLTLNQQTANFTDQGGTRQFHIGKNGFMDFSAVTTMGVSGTLNLELVVDSGVLNVTNRETNKTTVTRKVMSSGLDLSSKFNNVSVLATTTTEGEYVQLNAATESDSSGYTLTYADGGNKGVWVTYDRVTYTAEELQRGGDFTWTNTGTGWTKVGGDETDTSFINGDSVLFTANGKATVAEDIAVSSVTLSEGVNYEVALQSGKTFSVGSSDAALSLWNNENLAVTGSEGVLELYLDNNWQAAGDSRVILAEGSNVGEVAVHGVFSYNLNDSAVTSNLRGADLRLENGAYWVVRNGVTDGTVLDANIGDVLIDGRAEMWVYGSANATVIDKVTGTGALDKKDGGTVSFAGGIELGTLDASSGTVNIDHSSTITTLYAGATLNLNEGVISVGTLRGSEQGAATININTGATLNITGTNNTQTTGASLLLAHWGQTSSLNLKGGNLNAEGATMKLSWDGTGKFNATSGVANLIGISAQAHEGYRGEFNLGGASTGSARVNIGSGGIAYMQGSAAINLGGGTLGALADWELGYADGATGVYVNLISSLQGTYLDTLDANDGTTGRTVTFKNGLTGNGKLIKTGAGTLVLNGAANASFTGTVELQEGNLTVKNADVIGAGRLLIGGGNTVQVSEGTYQLRQGVLGSLGAGSTATLAADLVLGGGTLYFETLNEDTAALTVTGGITLADEASVTVEWAGDGLSAEENTQYKVLAGASLAESAADSFVFGGSLGDVYIGNFTVADNTLLLTLTQRTNILTWNGTQESASWNETDTTWQKDGTAATYTAGESVYFTNSAVNKNVQLASGVEVAPGAILITGSDYIFSGEGKIGGSTTLTVTGGASVDIRTVNAYTGGTVIEAGGEITINNGSALGRPSGYTDARVLGTLSGKGTLVIDTSTAASPKEVAIKGSTAQNFTGTIDVQSGELYLGQFNNNTNPGDAVTLGAETINVREGASLWIHLGGTGRSVNSDINLVSGSKLQNRDGDNVLNGDIRFNIVDPTAANPTYKNGAQDKVQLTLYWNKDMVLNGLLEGDGIVEMAAATQGKIGSWTLSNNNNTFQGSYNLVDSASRNDGLKLILNAENAARYATINLKGSSSVSTLQLNQSSVIKALNSTDADNIVTANDAEATLTVSSGSFNGKLQDGTGILSLEKVDDGLLVLDGANNTYSGGTTILAGNLAVKNAASLGTGAVTLSGGNLIWNAAAATIQQVNVTASSDLTVYDLQNNVINPLRLSTVDISDGATLSINNNTSNVNIEEDNWHTSDSWKQYIHIDVLTGDGDLNVQGPGSTKHGQNAEHLSKLVIDSMAGFTGDITVTSREGETAASTDVFNVTLNTGAQGTTLGQVSIAGYGEAGEQSSFTFNIQGDTSIDTLNMAAGTAVISAGTTLTLGDGSASSAHTIGNLAGSEGSMVSLAANALLNKVNAVTGSVKLTGSGTYDAGSSHGMTANMSLATDWTGTVKIHDVTTNADIKLNALGVSGSRVDINNVQGYFEKADNGIIYNPDINLSGNLRITNGYSNSSYTFAGTISGSGTLSLERTGGSPNTFYFTKDISSWTGALTHSAQTDNIHLTAAANMVNAAITNTDGTLNLTVNTTGAATFSKNVTVSTLDLAQTASFAAGLTTSGNVTIASGKNINLAGSNTIGGLLQGAGSNTLYITANGTEVNFNGAGTHVIKNIDPGTYTGITYNVKNGATLQVSENMWMKHSSIRLEEGASFNKSNNNILVTGTGANSTISMAESGTSSLTTDNAAYTISNAEVEMTHSAESELKMKLTESSLTSSGSSLLIVSNAGNTITSLAANGGNVKLSESMSVQSISAKAGKVVTVANGKTISMAGGVSLSANGAEATMTAKSDSALARLQQDASFTIEDMTLTNTTITAATVDTEVNLKNVDAEKLALAQGKFTMEATPVVGGGGTSVDFGTGVSSLEAGSASLTLNLDMMGAYASTGAVNDVTLTIRLDVSGAEFNNYTVENWQALVGFEQDSWLGEALTNATVTADVTATADTGSGVPTVNYGFSAGEGGSVGTLTITISGLNVPEPTTSTLSLLALAALAARRRRND